MASDNHAHYARVGFTVVIGVAAIAATLVYLGGFRDRRNEVFLETYYDYPVSGLSVGSPVNFRGVKIGEVREIWSGVDRDRDGTLTRVELQSVGILMALDRKRFSPGETDDARVNALVRRYMDEGLCATVTSSGITGLSRVELSLLENAVPVTAGLSADGNPIVPSSPSLIESFSETAVKLMNRLRQMDFASVWSNVQKTAHATARLAENADAFIECERAGASEIVRNVSEITASMRELTDAIKANPSLLLRPADPQPLPETAP